MHTDKIHILHDGASIKWANREMLRDEPPRWVNIGDEIDGDPALLLVEPFFECALDTSSQPVWVKITERFGNRVFPIEEVPILEVPDRLKYEFAGSTSGPWHGGYVVYDGGQPDVEEDI